MEGWTSAVSWRNDPRHQWRLRNPWFRHVEYARRRCRDTKSRWWKFYGAKGITCTLTCEEAKTIWHRDRAWELKRPSLDRIKADQGYTLHNCRFIEQAQNARMALDPQAAPNEYPPCPVCMDADPEHKNCGAPA